MPPDFHNDVACAIRELAFAVRDHTSEQKMEFNWMVTHHNFATKRDIQDLKDDITMKLSEIRQAISTASKQNKEALAELGTKIADLNAQIAELIANASDPEVTDEQFLTDLNSLREDAQALADIVPGSPTPGGGPTDGSSTPQP